MECVNCQTEEAPAYTLRAHVADDRTVDLRFCSIECLDTWT